MGFEIKARIKYYLGIGNYDRDAERLIYKSINLYHKGGKINYWRSLRLYNYIRKKYACNIWPGIDIGIGTYIAHAHDVCIGKTAIIGNNCKFYPHCDITAAVKGDEGKADNVRRHAKIGDDCVLGNGALVIGAITIGNDVFIGARAIVTKDVPDHTVVKGVNNFRPKRPEEIPKHYRQQ